LHKPTVGAHRDRVHTGRSRASLVSRVNGLSIRTTRAFQARLRGGLGSTAVWRRVASAVRPLGAAERALPITVAAIVAIASLLAVLPSTTSDAVGRTQGSGVAARLAIGGGVGVGVPDDQRTDQQPSFQPLTLHGDPSAQIDTSQASPAAAQVLDDGTLVAGYVPETSVEDGSDLIRTYKVKSGDTLVEIARKFGVSMMTLWWANNLDSKDALHVGQALQIPPVTGLVYKVKTSDTLDTVAAQYKVDPSDIVALNGLADPTLVVGQVLILPGAKGAPIPTPKPTPKPKAVQRSSSGSSSSSSRSSRSRASSGAVHYSGGKLRWPVVGGGNYISQYFHYGHEAIDIAADYGSKVVAAAGGKVIFAGWKSNGGGYQVWISHGGNLYTTYNHMSAITVAHGQSVGRGQQVGRIGQSGWATGPHLHFEVWVGPVWSGGKRVNPLRYF
jgi:murein DD-endopeptidase MepM/ murein hydrolase activator NlpD